jgi:hypothetical protein
LQGAYNNSSAPATITTTDNKNVVFNLADTSTDSSFLVNLQCTSSCSTNGKFAIQAATTDVFSVAPNGGTISLGVGGFGNTIQIGNTTGAVTQTINIGNNTTGSSTNNINIGSSIAGTTAITGPATITNRASGSADTLVVNNFTSTGMIAKFQDNGTNVLSLADGGSATFQNAVNSANAFQVQNYNGTSILNLSTISNNQNLITNPSFESGTTGWAKLQGAETTFAASSTNPQSGTQSLNVVTTIGGTNQGAKYTYNFKPNTTYLYSVYTSLSANGGTAYAIGANVSGSDVTCTGNGNGLTFTTAVTRWTCGFTTGNTTTGSDYVFVRRASSDTTIRTLYIDAAQLEYATSPGSSATTFADQPYPNLVNTADFENSTSGWSAKGTATVSMSDDFANFGARSLKVVTGTSANNGAQYRNAFNASSRYSLSFWARRDTTSAATFNIGRADNGTDSDCLTGQTISTTWTQFSCTFTTGSTIGSSANFYVKQTDTATDNIYIDGVTLVASGVSQGYNSGGQSIQVDPLYSNISINVGYTGSTQAWQTSSTALSTALAYPGVVAANGYLYYVGGENAGNAASTVEYAKINANGSIGSWTTTTSMPQVRTRAGVVVANGYMYVVGGTDLVASKNTTYFAKLNSDGTVGTWKCQGTAGNCGVAATNANSLAAIEDGVSAFTSNGFIYLVGGSLTTVNYARLNADGSTQAWSTTTALPDTPINAPAVVASGYAYVMGGRFGGVSRNTIYYGKINADGTISSWSTTGSTNSMSLTRDSFTAVASNGYLYAIGGLSGANNWSSIEYAKLGENGTIGSWTVSQFNLPVALYDHGSAIANGYIYSVGGYNSAGTEQSAAYYTSTARVQIAGSLDLVGLSGQDFLDSGNQGGSLTAGNTDILGVLSVRGSANMQQSLAVNDSLSVGGNALFQNSTNSATAFQIQNAAGTNQFLLDTTNSKISIGTSDATGTLLILDTDTDATVLAGVGTNAATEVDGAMFYSSTSRSFVCGQNGAWLSCLGGLRSSQTAASNAITAASDTNFSGGSGISYTIPANDCVPGRVYRVTAYGRFTTGASIRTITFKVKFGATVLATSGPISTSVNSIVDRGWSVRTDITCITAGSSGTVEAQGTAMVTNSLTGVTSNEGDMPNTGTVTVNTTTTQTLQLSAGWDATTNSPTLTMRSIVIEGLGP